eukprot:2359587-Amphidinium_carterae.1
MDVADAGDFVLGSIRPTRASSKSTMSSTLWHIHRDATFTLSSAYYHSSMLPISREAAISSTSSR